MYADGCTAPYDTKDFNRDKRRCNPCSEHTSLKSVIAVRFMASEREWLPQTAEKCSREDARREEQDSPTNLMQPQSNHSFNLRENLRKRQIFSEVCCMFADFVKIRVIKGSIEKSWNSLQSKKIICFPRLMQRVKNALQEPLRFMCWRIVPQESSCGRIHRKSSWTVSVYHPQRRSEERWRETVQDGSFVRRIAKSTDRSESSAAISSSFHADPLRRRWKCSTSDATLSIASENWICSKQKMRDRMRREARDNVLPPVCVSDKALSEVSLSA